jgi:hypothetical protein
MNYGKEFIKLHNKELSTFRKEFIARIEKDYESPLMEEDLFKSYANFIQGEINKNQQFDNKKGSNTSIMVICWTFLLEKRYKINRIENIFERDIFNYYLDHYKYSNYNSFDHFMQLLSKFSVLREFSKLLRQNRDLFCKLLSKREIKKIFIIKYNKDDLNKLDTYIDNKKKEPQKESKELVSKVIELEDNEKSILLNILFFHLNDISSKDIPLTEKYRLLILCSSVLKEEDFSKIKTGYKTFDYFKLGINKTQKFNGDKRILIENIIDKLKKLSGLNELINSIKKLKNQDSFYS